MKIKSIFSFFVLVVLCFSNVALASKYDIKEDHTYTYNYAELNNLCPVYDPYESVNRKIFFINGVLDTIITRPIAKGYGKLTNEYTKDRVGSFVGNISEPLTAVNFLIQGQGQKTGKAMFRFFVNSTFGVLGAFDVAGKFGLKADNPQTFGNTLGSYGVGSGPYIVLPILGGMGARDVMDPLVLDTVMNPFKYVVHSDFKNVVTGVKIVHNRDKIMPFTDHVTKTSPDPYVAIRNAILSEREDKMAYPEGFKCPSVKK